MSKRTKAAPEEKDVPEVRHEDEEAQDPPETRRTRSGRRVRAPAALLESAVPARTPSRRTRRSVIQELREAEDVEAESEADQVTPAEPEPEPQPEPAEPAEAEPDTAESGAPVNGDAELSRPAATETETAPAAPEAVTHPQKKPRLGSSVKPGPAVPLGKPKSGRVWKDRNKQRFSALVRDKPLCSSWEKKMAAKREKELVKKFSLQLKEEKDRQKEDKRKRREENLKRRTENERKAEIVQVIRNTTKIKRMKKKQLRKIEKRDTLALLQKTNSPAAKSKQPKNKKAAAPTTNLT